MKKYLLIFVFSIILYGCYKDPITYYVTDDFKEWVVFQPGSYWIYQNGLIKDSIAVNDIENGISENYGDGKIWYFKEYFTVDYFNSDSTINSDRISAGPNGQRAYRRGSPFNHILLVKDFETKYNIIDELKIGNTTFYNMKQVHISNNSLDSVVIDYYIAKNYGVVKKEIQDSSGTTTWNLVEWNIVQ